MLKLHGSAATPSQLEQLAIIKQNIADVLTEVPGKLESEAILINTSGSPTIHSIPYQLCPAWRAKVKEEIELLLKGDIIEPGKGPWSSPIVPVHKPDGNIRLWIDFRKLNSVTTSDPFCMPFIEDLLDQIGTNKVLSKIDFWFHQIPVRLEDQDKMVFVTPFGPRGCLLASRMDLAPFNEPC